MQHGHDAGNMRWYQLPPCAPVPCLCRSEMNSPWGKHIDDLQRIFSKNELPMILASLPSWAPERVDTLFLVRDDDTIRKAVETAIQVAGARCQELAR